MQENYEDGSKGEVKLVAWGNLVGEIKKSLGKDKVKSVTVSKTVGMGLGHLAKVEEEEKSLLEQVTEFTK